MLFSRVLDSTRIDHSCACVVVKSEQIFSKKRKITFESFENDGSLEVQRINRTGVEAAYE